MERLFGLDAQLLFEVCLTAIAVFLLFAVLSYLLFNPVRDLLRKRQELIQETRDTANREKEHAMELKAQYDKKMQKAEVHAEEILTEARKHALKKEKIILEEAKEESARMVSKANGEIELGKKKAMDDLRQELVEIAAMMAGKIVSVSIDEKTRNDLFENTLKEIDDGTWQS